MSAIPEQKSVKEHFDKIAKDYDMWKKRNWYYYANIKSFVKRNIRPKSKVLDVGCATGEILAVTDPSLGVGIDISPEMVKLAINKFPQYKFISAPVEKFQSDEKFDYIILVDVVDKVYDIENVFRNLYKVCHPATKIILTSISPWWDPILALTEKLRAKAPEGPHNYFEISNIIKILEPLDFKVNYSGYMLLWPKFIPGFSYLANSIGVRTYGLRRLSSVQYMIIQPTSRNTTDLGLGCSVIIPCYNEEGNIENAVRRIPPMGKRTEIVVVNDGSKDKTAEIVRSLQKEMENLVLIDYSPNRGKGQAVKAGFDAATEEIIMILDADISVTPEELPRFFDPLNKGMCQFVNGSRMVYPMEGQAMRFLNFFGNKLFGQIMTFVTNQRLTDTLCGTKALYKKDYQQIKMGLDKWGDFDLLFGAAKMGNKIMEITVHYKDRVSGESKMKTFRHGFHLLSACIKGFRDLVFIHRTAK